MRVGGRAELSTSAPNYNHPHFLFPSSSFLSFATPFGHSVIIRGREELSLDTNRRRR